MYIRTKSKSENTKILFKVKFSQGNHLVDILYQVNMFRSNECLSCKYERSKRKVRFEEVIDIVKKTKKVDLLPPKIKNWNIQSRSYDWRKKSKQRN